MTADAPAAARVSRRRDIRSASAVRVRSINSSDTDVFAVADELSWTPVPTGLADHGELARRDAGEHPVHHRPGQRVAVSEVLSS